MDGLAQFRVRETCITCRSARIEPVCEGHYADEPLRGFLAADPWGESPMPALAGAWWRLVRCAECGTRFHGRILTPEWRAHCLRVWMSGDAIEAFEARDGQAGFPSRFDKAAFWTGHVLSIEAMTRDGRRDPLKILDFGCGSGEFLAHAALFGARAYGIDASPARRAFAGRSEVSIVADLADLPEELRGSFDAVTLFEVLEHLDDPRAVLESLRPWVRQGGLLVLETPDAAHVSAIRTLDEYRLIHPLDHINAFSPRTLGEIARLCGFRRVRRRLGYTSAGPVQTLKREARRLLQIAAKPTTRQYFRAA